MSITNATTSIDLSWVELADVGFTAGTLSDMDALKTEVESKLQRGTLSGTSSPTTTEVQVWLVRAKEEVMESHGFTFARRFVYATATTGTYRFALPPDFGGGTTNLRDTTANRKIPYCDPHTFDGLFPDVSEFGNSSSSAFTIKGNTLWVVPPANGATIELEYTRTGDDNDATDISYIPEKLRFKIVDLAVSEAFEYLQEFEKAKYYQGKASGRLRVAAKADGKQKWASMGYMAKNWLY